MTIPWRHEKWESRETNGLDVFSSWGAPRHVGQLGGLRSSLVVICDVLFSGLTSGPGDSQADTVPVRQKMRTRPISRLRSDGHNLHLTLGAGKRNNGSPPPDFIFMNNSLEQ